MVCFKRAEKQLDMHEVTQLLSPGDQDWTTGSHVTQVNLGLHGGQTPNQPSYIPNPQGLGSSMPGSSPQPSDDTSPTKGMELMQQDPSPRAMETGFCECWRAAGAKQGQLRQS